MSKNSHVINELVELHQVAAHFKDQVSAGEVVYLVGDLGAGKTTFAQLFLKVCGIKEPVKSPTYTLYETYKTKERTYVHMDLYRLTDAEELYFMGIEDLINGNNILLVEWPNKGAGVMPEADWLLEFELTYLNRTLTITSIK